MNTFHFSPATIVLALFLSLSLLPHQSCWGFDLDACHACFEGQEQNGCNYCVKDIMVGATKATVEMCDCDEVAVLLYGDCSVFESSYKAETNIASGCKVLANPKKYIVRYLLIGLAVLLVLIMSCVGCCICACRRRNNKDRQRNSSQQPDLVVLSGSSTMKTTGIEKPKETI
jgi:uncharacterized protein YgbK (DUF1537 family)